jgi:hypothetical protein
MRRPTERPRPAAQRHARAIRSGKETDLTEHVSEWNQNIVAEFRARAGDLGGNLRRRALGASPHQGRAERQGDG